MKCQMVGLSGTNINRRTAEHVHSAGPEIESIEHLGPGQLVNLIVAHPCIRKVQFSSCRSRQL